MSLFSINIIYLLSAICFIFSLQGLSSPSSARNGVLIGITGMILSILATFMYKEANNTLMTLIAISGGGVIGGFIAARIKMTDLPQLVAGFHSLVGLAAVLISVAAFLSPENFNIGISGSLAASSLLEMSLGASIGAITFTGSIIACGKLQGIIPGKPIKFDSQKYLNIFLILLIIYLMSCFTDSQAKSTFYIIILLSLLLGISLIIPIGGADMPVIVSMLNSYSGWAASGIGFTLNNSLLIITGALVGSSGAILSYIMCKAMNRSLYKVIFGAFTSEPAKLVNTEEIQALAEAEDAIKSISFSEGAEILSEARSVIIVPGYGMAVAQAQHIVRELYERLKEKNIKVRFAIHPVAGRMPGHMNVLLAEANIDYEDVLELDEINQDFADTDVALVIGANDITNPAAETDESSPIYGMPILNVKEAKNVLFIKRGMSAGYAGIENHLFYQANTRMLFGDAKKVLEEIVKLLG